MLEQFTAVGTVPLFLIGILAWGYVGASSAESRTAVDPNSERWLTIRVYPNISYTTGAWGKDDSGDLATASPLTEADIEGWMKDCADHGVTTVLWQAHCGGTACTHPSPVFPLPGYLGHTPEAPEPWEGAYAWWDFLGEQVRRFDTLNAAIAAAHKYGLRFAYSLCPWDFVDYTPRPEDNVFSPNLWMLSRDGEPLVGVPCYAEPEVQELVLTHVRDVLDRGVDDLAITFFSHTAQAGVDQPYHYGFNPPLVEAYQERYGADPVHESFDAAAWYSVYGDFYTEFLHRLHQETSQRGQRLIPCTTHDGRWGGGGSGGRQLVEYYYRGGPAPTVAPGWGIEFQWRRWAQEGIADALLLLAPPPDAVPLAKVVRQEANVPVLLWRKMNPGIPEEHWATYRREAAQAAAGGLNGYVVHAMITVNYGDYPDKLWSIVQAAAGQR